MGCGTQILNAVVFFITVNMVNNLRHPTMIHTEYDLVQAIRLLV